MYWFTIRPKNELVEHCVKDVKSTKRVHRELPGTKRVMFKF
jgi:hypothetical protein